MQKSTNSGPSRGPAKGMVTPEQESKRKIAGHIQIISVKTNFTRPVHDIAVDVI